MRDKKEKKSGFFCREIFMEQIELLENAAQIKSLLWAAIAYMKEESLDIIDKEVKMAFSAWKLALDYDIEYHKERNKNSIRANEIKKAKREAKESAEATAQPSDDIPCAEVEVVDPHSFDVFWNLYKYKRGKAPALKAWNKLKDSDKAAAIEAVPNYLAYLDYKRATGREQEQMHASTYLNQRRWEDDYTITTPINTNYHGNNNRQSYKEAEFERNARTVTENLQAAERGELAYLSPFNPPSGQR